MIYGLHSKPSARVERCVLRLQPVNFQVVYVPSLKNIANSSSRLLSAKSNAPNIASAEVHVNMVAAEAVPSALSIADADEASKKDEELTTIRHCLQRDLWEEAPKGYIMV